MTEGTSPSDSSPEQNRPTSSEESHQLSIRRVDSSQQEEDKPASEVTTPEEAATASPRLLFTPPIDIFGTDAGLVLRADLPGVCVERLDLQIEDNKLTLFGRVEHAAPEEGELVHQEYQVGDFYRSFILSDELDYDRISAKMNLGVLEIHLPRIPRAQPRKIQVQSE